MSVYFQIHYRYYRFFYIQFCHSITLSQDYVTECIHPWNCYNYTENQCDNYMDVIWSSVHYIIFILLITICFLETDNKPRPFASSSNLTIACSGTIWNSFGDYFLFVQFTFSTFRYTDQKATRKMIHSLYASLCGRGLLSLLRKQRISYVKIV